MRGSGEALRREASFAPERGETAAVLAFAEGFLSAAGCGEGCRRRWLVAVDEVFSNIAKYSSAREVRVECGTEGEMAVMRFSDDGRAFDPLEREAPPTDLPLEEREAGGLGILIVRRLMDGVEFARAGGRNVLTLRKRIG
jgi:anti-sigma regulatory factor (Ser/Thr protein kinase)